MFTSKCKAMLASWSPWAPLPLRLVLGVIFIAHGGQKLFGWFGGGGFADTAQSFQEGIGLSPGWLFAALGGGGEFFGGVLVLLGLFTRFGALLIASTMMVAIFAVHLKNGLFAKDGGFEYPLALLGASISLMLSGGGQLALDNFCCKGSADEKADVSTV